MAKARLVAGTPNRYQFTAPADLVGGDVVTINNLTVINTANPTVASGDVFGGDIGGGIYEAIAGEAIAVGMAVYLSVATGKLTEVATDTFVGKAVTASTATDQKICFLHQQAEVTV